MLNAILAWLALVVWGTAYGLFFGRELRPWWRNRGRRQAMKEAERQQAVRTYAEWVRNIPPPPSHRPVFPPRLPPALPPTEGNVIPFPRRASARRR